MTAAATAADADEWRIALADDAATADFGRTIASSLEAGDLVTLSGDLGAGKTALARAIIRTLADDPALEAPSPTFSLIQTYDGKRFPIVHADLFRIAKPGDLVELGWEEASDGALVLVEWPERAGDALQADRIDILLSIQPDGSRLAVLSATGVYRARLKRMKGIHALLAEVNWLDARRDYMLGDASTRQYERLVKGDKSRILMIAPRRPDGPPIRNGRPYSMIARLAESIHAFVAMDRGLTALGYSAPKLFAGALETGLLLIEDLGSDAVTDADGPIPERYAAALDLLADLHGRKLATSLEIVPGQMHTIPDYDQEALLIEAELVLDWYAPHIAGTTLAAAARREFVTLWAEALAPVLAGPRTWTLRDYHSPNLIWLPERAGLKRIGLIDFQDAVIGHPAYDVASLLQDARVTVSDELELRLLSHYVRQRRAADATFDAGAFTAAYATLGAQRATKIVGIFARLDKRDGKPGYLRHLPRVERYLGRGLSHPVLSALKVWYETHMPRLFAAR